MDENPIKPSRRESTNGTPQHREREKQQLLPRPPGKAIQVGELRAELLPATSILLDYDDANDTSCATAALLPLLYIIVARRQRVDTNIAVYNIYDI
ncbi:hypothetical protein OUZ56_019003 [Daphnia magna]|uniref:Uncharacterized protein n=1 Tax=Daphnia magna TaxID=35525 RepID=A0ABQ9ZAI5_9CRUS|nr:hypothetical protein OUZ56_019003 [Daphnia magna]